ncbi:NAD-dependent epimerase/dehydratase family protein [Marichromatium gracile]|uniref:dTDP-6-deoxy-L-talose 4-dehydrogenase (NAD+) n=1 Tax=Marichromatium gracile TaxID=1048 RepID=A0A4R4ACA5_MARGR|nr:NAD(P)-dependent oxidoreductase [Marichromatium gracile]MBK1709324.1 epimerase [Marichromatium gracile]TCW36226.1 dTDP-6-deoxy-L-talose 4-dehydrogenase (NAD+) [Marichromatium gracile]
MTEVALTGASGFLGRHLAVALAQRCHALVCSARGERSWSGPGRFVPLDVRRPPAAAFARLGRPRVLIHLAWGGLPNYGDPGHYERELPAHYRFLEGLMDAGLERLVVAGTCLEYGRRGGACDETLCPDPDTPYGFAKDALRRGLEFAAARHGTQLLWTRLFYLWGEGQAAGSLYPQLLAAARRGERRFPMSGGEQLRDYLPVTEAAERLVRLALETEASGIVNLCSGRPVSVRALVERWIAEHGLEIEPALGALPYAAHEAMAFWGDSTRLRQLLELDPTDDD